ncbi:MAG TPA: DUF86 domain-containing protein [Terriglobia bacterium]|nr:DUF86 domain-containing protein [Terriglobia bacterium]
MSRDYKVFLEDILASIRRIRSYVGGLSLQEFTNDTKTLDAVIRNLEIIGEAVKKIPQDVRSQGTEVEWQKVGRLRDILIHEYFGVDVNIVWDVVQNKLDGLERVAERLLQ